MIRHKAIAAFLAASGWAGAERVPLAGDASARHYERIRAGARRAILMDVPPESGLHVAPFLAVTGWLRGHGFSAPRILAQEPDQGLMLMEDLGDSLFALLCESEPGCERDLYAAAIDLLVALQNCAPPGAEGGWQPEPYNMATLQREAALLFEWYLPAVTGRPVSADLGAEYAALTEAAFRPLLEASRVAVYRDFHAENLIWLPERPGHARIGLLDYQDMLIGHPAYDLVSLLEDARRDTAPELRGEMLARYLERSGAERYGFIQATHVLGAQRNLKIMGLFTRLCRRDGKPRYLDHLPRVWNHLAGDLAHPRLRALSDWVERHVPPPDARARRWIRAQAAS